MRIKRIIKEPAGMCPNMTKVKPKKRKKPNPYRAPNTVKRYYKGIETGIRTLKEDLLERIDDEEIRKLISDRAKALLISSSKQLTELEKRKTKEKEKKWEEEEWESI